MKGLAVATIDEFIHERKREAEQIPTETSEWQGKNEYGRKPSARGLGAEFRDLSVELYSREDSTFDVEESFLAENDECDDEGEPQKVALDKSFVTFDLEGTRNQDFAEWSRYLGLACEFEDAPP
jgi:hypothetical protein